ncbi:hypothetical protein OC846_000248 [Tilletia horrida]|uniref:Uncharacterized protein n=1 Tax=Tilletia horrida TaxID=155126 RepID=A0AAN6GY37_9BASI|nr:hypothetical protein OC846_000248 [Tilletia horrida]KAK0570345.1 hypothetical protein OC861_000088 [Tilletia horrida]
MSTHRQARSSPPAALVAVSALSILGGLLIHTAAVHLAPTPQLQVLFLKTEQQLAKDLKMSNDWPEFLRGVHASHDPKARSAIKTLLVLLVFFRNMLASQLGKGLLWLLTVASMPLMLHLTLESIKAGRHRAIGAVTLIVVTSIGQVFCLGGATSIISVPAHAYARYVQISQALKALDETKKTDTASAVTMDDVLHPRPSASFLQTHFSALLSGFVVLTIALSAHVPPVTHTQAWIASNVAFQFFPVFFLPLLIPGVAAVAAKAGSKASSAPASKHSARIYLLVSLLSIPLWWFGAYLCAAPLAKNIRTTHSVIKGVGGLKGAYFFVRKTPLLAIAVAFPLTHGEWLLIWDLVGILIATISIIFIDRAADEWADSVFSGRVDGYQSLFGKRNLIPDVATGLPPALLFGPGFAASRYFQRREEARSRIGAIKSGSK